MAITRIPPHDDDAELAVLGALLIDREAITIVSEVIKPDNFYSDINRMIYEAMLSLWDDRKPIDLLTLTTALKVKKQLEKVGGSTFLSSLANVVPTAANVEHYANIIRERHVRRSMISLGAHMTDIAFQEDKPTAEILDEVEQSIFRVSQEHVQQGFIHIKETLAESFDRLDELHKSGGSLRGVETGFTDIDNLLSGMQPSNLLILAARPGTGKTAFVINASMFAAAQKNPVAIFSLEMSKEELVDRLLVCKSEIDAWKLKTGRLNEQDFEKLSLAMGELAEYPIFIDDTPGISVAEIRTKARRLHLEHGLKMIVVDYLQLANAGKKFENRNQEVSFISQSMKNLARELRIPVLACSQLSRAVEHRGGDKKPQLADLRESGAIEQDADVVMFLYNPEEMLTPQRIIRVLVAKHRNGATGEKELLFRGDKMKFYNIDHSQITQETTVTVSAG
ncbi:MAG TPA: replicative DNA helicase [Candidatus Levybacteria bacterium]|nr:replicative DNA helicase [Candidatus Levybacteria bacterium]